MDEKSPEAFRTISEVAVDLDLPQHVLRFWESRFREIKPMKRGGGRRFYRPNDILLLRGIKHLLYGEGYTIRGVQRILREQGIAFVQEVWEQGAPQPPHGVVDEEDLVEEAESAEDMLEEESGLRGRLSSLIGHDFSDRAGPALGRDEPPLESAPMPRVYPQDRIAGASPRIDVPVLEAAPQPVPQPKAAALARDDVHRLHAVLHELTECRKLIDAAVARNS